MIVIANIKSFHPNKLAPTERKGEKNKKKNIFPSKEENKLFLQQDLSTTARRHYICKA